MRFKLTNRDIERIRKRLRQAEVAKQNGTKQAKRPRVTGLGLSSREIAYLAEFQLDDSSPVGFFWNGFIPVPNGLLNEYIPFLQTQTTTGLIHFL